jgi:membrane peptidoglycan carboxypeptidase
MDQAAALAATLPHPLTSNPRTRPGRMEWRKQMILARMGGSGTATTVPLEPEGAAERPMGEAVQLPPADTPPDAPDADTSGPPAHTPGEVAPAEPDTAAPHQNPDADAGAPPASAPA